MPCELQSRSRHSRITCYRSSPPPDSTRSGSASSFHSPVGLNIYIINVIAPDVPIVTGMLGAIPYVLCMMLAIVILCFFPEIATWLPDHLMGHGG